MQLESAGAIFPSQMVLLDVWYALGLVEDRGLGCRSK